MKNSLERLGVEYLDVIFMHRPDSGTPMLETIRAINHLIEEDKAFYWGTSMWTPGQIVNCHRLCEKYGYIAPHTEQPQYNMLNRERVEVEYAMLYDEFGMGCTVWSPLAGGLLSGKYNEGVLPEGSRYSAPPAGYAEKFAGEFSSLFSEANREKTSGMLNGLKDIAEELGGTQAQLCLAWTLKNNDISTAINGATRIEQVNDNLGAVQMLDKITPEVLERIEGLLGNRPA